jgi:hypothetical protein
MSDPRALMIVFMAASQTLQCLAAGMNRRGSESQPRKIASRPEEPPANQNDGSSPTLLDSYSVCYWTDTTFVIGWL